MKLAKRNRFFQKRRSRLDLTIEHNTQAETPNQAQIEKFVLAALQGLYDESIISMIFVDEAEGRALNLEHRGKDYATNVLSFALNEGEDTPANLPLFGDLVLCCPVVEKEAQAQNRPLLDHYAHLIVHGILHLQGYDHIKDDEAEEMESLETRILAKLGFPDPYLEEKI